MSQASYQRDPKFETNIPNLWHQHTLFLRLRLVALGYVKYKAVTPHLYLIIVPFLCSE